MGYNASPNPPCVPTWLLPAMNVTKYRLALVLLSLGVFFPMRTALGGVYLAGRPPSRCTCLKSLCLLFSSSTPRNLTKDRQRLPGEACWWRFMAKSCFWPQLPNNLRGRLPLPSAEIWCHSCGPGSWALETIEGRNNNIRALHKNVTITA